MPRIKAKLRYLLFAISFVALCLLLNRPEIILLNRLGYVVWYPAVGLTLGLMLGVSPLYAPLVYFAGVLSGRLFYNQAFATYGQTIGALGSVCFYGFGAYVLRSPLKIDSGLHRRRDVFLYVSVTTVAAIGSTAIGVACLAADHTIAWSEYWQSASVWFLGDEIGLLAVAPFLLIHVFPWVRDRLTREPAERNAVERRLAGEKPNICRAVEGASQVIALLLILWVMFVPTLARFELYFLSFIPIIWIAMRHGIQRVASGLLALNFGIVVALHFFPATQDQLSKIGLLMFVVSAAGLLVGSAVTERHRIAIELFERTADLQLVNSQLLLSKEKAEEANRIKGEFLANMSHEIRTPINGILGMAELILDTEITAEQRDYLTMLKSSGGSLLRIVNDILNFSKIESGRLELDPVVFDVRETIEAAMKAITLQAQEKGLSLSLEVSPELPRAFFGDSGRLSQILINLLGNAVKFTEEGGIVVRAGIDSAIGDAANVHFSVEDTGIGISSDKHELIFEAFVQADGSITRHYGGTGLGLAISSRLVALLGGRIWVQSESGRGSTFHFIASLKTANNSIPATNDGHLELLKNSSLLHPATAPPVPACQSLRILVVEDNLVNQTVMVRMLANQAHSAIVAGNGKEALLALNTESFDLMFMDVQMPEMDGLTATRKIRQMEKEKNLGHIPIVAMTAHAMKGDKEICLEAGMDYYIEKPASGKMIKDVITQIFKDAAQPGGAISSVRDSRTKLWSTEEALKRLDGDESLLKELTKIFMEESPAHLETLQRAIHDADADAIQRSAHTLRGELNCLGLAHAGELAGNIESLGRRRELATTPELFSAFRAEISAATSSMHDDFGSQQKVLAAPTPR